VSRSPGSCPPPRLGARRRSGAYPSWAASITTTGGQHEGIGEWQGARRGGQAGDANLHDQLMKQALQERFADFLGLFDPDTAAELDLEAGVTFRNAEMFTDFPQGALLVPDIVAEVRTLAGVPRLIIIHVEVQREREQEDFARRMWRYYIALLQPEDKPIIPTALLFYMADEGVAWEMYEDTLFGHTIVTFRYLQISLARLASHAEEYLETGNVLAAALAGIMGRARHGAVRAQLYYRCLQRLMDAERAGEVNRATVELLGDVVETYLIIGADDRAALRRQVEAEGGDIMALEATELTWRSRVDLDVTVRTRREGIRKAVEVRFGRVSPEVDAGIGETETEEELNALFERALRAQTENDVLHPTR